MVDVCVGAFFYTREPGGRVAGEMEAGYFFLYGEGVLKQRDDTIGHRVVVYTELQSIGLSEGEGECIIMIGYMYPFFGYGGDDLFGYLAGGVGADGVVVGEGGGAERDEVDDGGVEDEAGVFEEAVFYFVVLPDLEGEAAGGGGEPQGVGRKSLKSS